jgi:hypothetical protein
MKLTLSIPIFLPKLPNQLLGARWFIRSAEAKKWKRLVGDALVEAEWQRQVFKAPDPPLPMKKARITLTRCSPRQCDFDGLVGSMKPVLDALVHQKVIEDDTPEHVSCDYVWEKTTKLKQGIRIEVEG